MSFLHPTVQNPALNWYEWRKGQLSHYDKEKKENIPVKLPFPFIVLEELILMTGYHKPSNSGISSNEVRKISEQQLHVKAFKGGPIADGLYSNIKDKVKAAGGKYTRSIYIAEKMPGGYVISNIKFSGAAFSGWLEFSRTCNVENGKVILTGSVEGTNGATTFQTPTFEYTSLADNEFKICTELATDLDNYLSSYMDKTELEHDEQVPDDEIDPNLGKTTPEQRAEFERLKAEKLGNGRASTTGTEETFDDQEAYNRQAIDDIFGSTDDDAPLPEYRG